MRRRALSLAALAVLGVLGPARASAGEPGARVLVKRERESALSALLVASKGKLVVRQSIPALQVVVLAGKGEWSNLDGVALAAKVTELARTEKLALGWVESDVPSRAAEGCCQDARLFPVDAEAQAKRAHDLAWTRRALNLDDVNTGARGTLVALLDTGIEKDNPFFDGASIEAESLLDDDRSPDDRNGHGTAMAGVIVARGEHALDPKGIAQDARLLSIKVMDERGSGDVATLARGIVRAADRNAKVILVSAGVATPSRALEDAVAYARSRGALVVAAAGNEPVGRALSPARTKGALGVTASRQDGRLSLAVALDPAVELAAPGADVLTTLPRQYGAKGTLGGTSLSAAFAAGVAALGFGEGADADQVLRAMRGARRPIAAFKGFERTFPLGELDAKTALARLRVVDRAIDSVVTYPAVARAGSSIRVVARVRASGGRVANGGALAVVIAEQKVGEVTLPALPADGSAVDVEARVTVPASFAGERLPLTVAIADEDPSNNVRTIAVPVVAKDAAPTARLALADVQLDDAARLLQVTIENQGEAPEEPGLLVTTGELALRPASSLELLAPGARATVAFALPDVIPHDGIVRFEITARGRSSVAGTFDVRLGGTDPRPVKPQYQQSNDVDIIADAPYRLEPGRAYVPFLLFNPSKGDSGNGIDLTIDAMTVVAQDTPKLAVGQPANLLYRYDLGTNVKADPKRYAAGTEILDEDGKPYANGSLNLFSDQAVKENGRHAIFRFPRAGMGVAAVPAAPVKKYLDAKLHFVARRNTVTGSIAVDQGNYHKVMEVTFASKALPVLPGAGRYYDTHVHTVAEWYVTQGFDLMAPRKAYGGPIVMLREAAYSVGLTDRVDAAPGSIITTDHSCFNNEQDPEAMTGNRRIQVGPTAPRNSLGPNGKPLAQLARFKELLGPTANEEVAFEQDQKAVGPLGLPLGAHLLAFRAGHWEERWNGGDGGASPNKRKFGTGSLPLTEVLQTLSTFDADANKDAFIFSAHPFTSQGWNTQALEEGLELKAAANGTRTGKYFNRATDNFVLKGHQLWNGRTARTLPSARIDFSDLNPYADADFSKGDANFARTLEEDLLTYQRQLSSILRYQRASEPGRVFARKLYVAAGSDAHGDFNFSEGRLATPFNVQSTFTVDDSAFGRARTYVLTDGVNGATLGDKGMTALGAGRSIVTDGPLARLALDADGRFDSAKLVFHAGSSRFEDQDGQIGGGGLGPDGARTALVVAGSEDGVWSYHYEDAPEGKVTSIELYRIEAGKQAPFRNVKDVTGKAYESPAPAGTLPVGAPGQALEAPADKAAAGAFENLCAVQLGAFAGADPSKGSSPASSSRCYANPVFVAPVKVEFVKRDADLKAGKFPKGSIVVRYTFPISMKTLPYKVEVKGTDSSGNTTDGSVAGFELVPSAGTGWTDDAATGTKDSVFEVQNATDVTLAQYDYPRQGTATFAVYFRDVPQDSFGNPLNRIAVSFESPRVGTPAPTLSANPGSTAQPTGFTGGRSGGGSGCALGGGNADGRALLPIVFVAFALVVRRRRAS